MNLFRYSSRTITSEEKYIEFLHYTIDFCLQDHGFKKVSENTWENDKYTLVFHPHTIFSSKICAQLVSTLKADTLGLFPTPAMTFGMPDNITEAGVVRGLLDPMTNFIFKLKEPEL